MKVTVLGCGNPYAVSLLPASYFVECGTSGVLVGCGPGIPVRLAELGLEERVTHVVATSIAAHDIGGLEQLILRAARVRGKRLYWVAPRELGVQTVQRLDMSLRLEGLNPRDCLATHYGMKFPFLDGLVLSFYPIAAHRCAILVGRKSRAVLFCGDAPSELVAEPPYGDADLIIQHIAPDGTRTVKDLPGVQRLAAKAKNVWVGGFRDRDPLMLPVDYPRVLQEGQVFTL